MLTNDGGFSLLPLRFLLFLLDPLHPDTIEDKINKTMEQRCKYCPLLKLSVLSC